MARSGIANRLDECSESRDGAAHDERVHFAGALVAVERFGIGKEASHVVIEHNSVSPKNLSAPRDTLAHAGRGDGLRQGGVLIALGGGFAVGTSPRLRRLLQALLKY